MLFYLVVNFPRGLRGLVLMRNTGEYVSTYFSASLDPRRLLGSAGASEWVDGTVSPGSSLPSVKTDSKEGWGQASFSADLSKCPTTGTD